MNKVKSLLFTSDEENYKFYEKMVLFEFYIAKNISQAITFINNYFPSYILIDMAVSNQDKVGCFEFVDNLEKYHPIVIIAEKNNMEEILSHKRNIFMVSDKLAEIPAELDRKLDYMLMKLRFSVRLKGYDFIKRCIFEGVYNPSVFDNIKKQLYQKVADEFDTTVFSVERAITFSIKRAYEASKNNEELIRQFEFCGKQLTNSAFLKNLLISIKHLPL